MYLHLAQVRLINQDSLPRQARHTSILRANPYLRIQFADFPHLFYWLEALHLGDLLRIWVRTGNGVTPPCGLLPDFQGPRSRLRSKPYRVPNPARRFDRTLTLMQKRKLFPDLPTVFLSYPDARARFASSAARFRNRSFHPMSVYVFVTNYIQRNSSPRQSSRALLEHLYSCNLVILYLHTWIRLITSVNIWLWTQNDLSVSTLQNVEHLKRPPMLDFRFFSPIEMFCFRYEKLYDMRQGTRRTREDWRWHGLLRGGFRENKRQTTSQAIWHQQIPCSHVF